MATPSKKPAWYGGNKIPRKVLNKAYEGVELVDHLPDYIPDDLRRFLDSI